MGDAGRKQVTELGKIEAGRCAWHVVIMRCARARAGAGSVSCGWRRDLWTTLPSSPSVDLTRATEGAFASSQARDGTMNGMTSFEPKTWWRLAAEAAAGAMWLRNEAR